MSKEQKVANPAWMEQARRHWKQHQPQRYQALQKSQKLHEELRQAALMTEELMDQMGAYSGDGMQREEVWQQVREIYLFPKEEPEVTRLWEEGL